MLLAPAEGAEVAHLAVLPEEGVLACRSRAVLLPTTWPRSLIARAPLPRPPRVPRSVILPFCQRKACPLAGLRVRLPPITWPWSLIAAALLSSPPSVPSGVIVPFCQRKARPRLPVPLPPTIWPLSLMSTASLEMNERPSVPRSRITHRPCSDEAGRAPTDTVANTVNANTGTSRRRTHTSFTLILCQGGPPRIRVDPDRAYRKPRTASVSISC